MITGTYLVISTKRSQKKIIGPGGYPAKTCEIMNRYYITIILTLSRVKLGADVGDPVDIGP